MEYDPGHGDHVNERRELSFDDAIRCANEKSGGRYRRRGATSSA
jgi:hypothetical protein